VRTEWELTNTLTGAVQTGDVAGAGPVPVTVSGDGEHRLRTRLTDGLGDNSGWRTQYVRIDTVTPVDNTNPVTGWVKQALNVTVGGTDVHSDILRVEWKLNGVAGSFIGRSHVVQVSVEGVNTLETRVVDNAGLASEWKTHTIRLDQSLPTNLTATASSAWRNTPYSVTLNGSDVGSGMDVMRWRVGSGPVWEGVSGTVNATINTTGTHTLYTWAVDKVGNASVERAETIRIDTVPPNDATVYPGPAVPPGRKITFAPADADSGVAGIEWTLDGGAVQTGPSVTLVQHGAHTIATRVRDNAGNWSAWTSRTVTVNSALAPEDTDPPVDTTDVEDWQPGPYTVTVSAEDAVVGVRYVEWRIDGVLGRGPLNAASANVEFTTEGEHALETRAVDKLGNTSAWRSHVVKIDLTPPADTTPAASGWTGSRTVTLSATDATSKVAAIEYRVDGGAVATPVLTADPDVADKVSASFTLPADGKYRVAHRALDQSGQASAWKTDDVWVDTVDPVLTSAAAPVAWQTTALSHAVTGTDALSGVARVEWRVAGGEIKTGSPAVISTEGSPLLESRIVDKAGNESAWRSETVKIDLTKPVNTTVVPSDTWRKTNFTTTVTGSDPSPGSSLDRIEYKLDGGPVVTTPAVTISATGLHTLESRVRDVAGHWSDWRTDKIGIDKTAPSLSVNCGSAAWRSTPAACTVAAAGGESGLPTLTAARGTGSPDAITGTSYTVDAEGIWTVIFRAVDGAGNETLASANVKIDRTPPTAAVTCTPGAGKLYICKGTGADGQSGLAGLSRTVDGAAAAPLPGDGSFAVEKGVVVVSAIDAAGNVGTSEPLALADRTPPPPVSTPTPPPTPKTPAKEDSHEVTPRSSSEAVLLRKRGSASSRLVGQLSLAGTPTRTTVDLRPLALGKGRFHFTLKVTVDGKTKTVRKTQTTRKGYSRRISVRVGAAADATVKLTVRRRSGKRWVTHATASAKLG
jgi:hypothetical protein